MRALFISVAMFIAYQSTAQSDSNKTLISLYDIRKESAQLLFTKMQKEGTIICEGKDKEGRDRYTLRFLEANIVHLYIEEALEFLEAGLPKDDEQLNND